MKEDMYLRINQVTARTGLSRATIYSMMKIGSFPMKTALGVRAVGWLSSEIEHWMLARKTEAKKGSEANPGRKRTRQRPSEVHLSKSTTEVTKTGGSNFTPASHSGGPFVGWEVSSEPPCEAEMELIRSKLRAANRIKAVESVPVAKSVRTVMIQGQHSEPAVPAQKKITSEKVKLK